MIIDGGVHIDLLGEVGGVDGDNCRERARTHYLRQEAIRWMGWVMKYVVLEKRATEIN